MIVVTGGTGLVGAHLLYELLCAGATTIRALYRKSKNTSLLEKIFQTYNPNALPLIQKIEWVQADILDVPALERALQGVDFLYHCAGMVSFDDSDGQLLYQNNVEGTANIVNIALYRGVKKLCYVSTIATFSAKEGTEVTEQTPQELSVANDKAYALSKYSAEMEVWRGVQEGLPAIVVYPSVVVGVGVEQHSAMNIQKLCRSRYITQGGTGFVAAQDVAHAMRLLMESFVENQGFILSGENLSYQQFFEYLSESHPKLPKKKMLSTNALRWLSYADTFLSFFGKKRELSPKMVQTLQSVSSYNGEKITHTLPFTYTPIQEVLKRLVL